MTSALNYQEVLSRMDRASSLGEPFLFILDYEEREGYFFLDPLNVASEDVYFSFPSASTKPPRGMTHPINLTLHPESEASYAQRFEVIHRGLMRGDSFLANLTIRTPIETEATLEDIYLTSRATYRVLLPGKFVSFSPECFVQLREDQLSTYPMKGTIDAKLPRAAELLRRDYKEGCEHHTIVDLLRNDLSQVAHDVHVARFKYLTELHTTHGDLLQMSSEVLGTIDRSRPLRLGSLLKPLLPAGSISGAPKGRTRELIREAEGRERGFYTGICGYFDGESLDSAVLIRFIERESSGRLFYHSGGGITINSRMEEEYRECLQKIYIPQ